MDIISLFCGCGGLDKGFQMEGFNTIWANDYDRQIQETYNLNHPGTELVIGDITRIQSNQIPNNIFGLVGGPPCQSWSAAGKGKGIEDRRGKLFYEYIRVLKDKQPLFFLAENVSGMLNKRHKNSYDEIIALLENAGYNVTAELVNAADYGVPQNRKRVIIVGYRNDLGINFEFPEVHDEKPTVREYLEDISQQPIRSDYNLSQPELCPISNHEYFTGSYSYIFMSRNRVLDWESQSYTIQASGRQASIHPQAPRMQNVQKDVMEFVPGQEHLYRRLSIRECARIQTFPDNFIFRYNSLDRGYKMIGNAVPVNLARAMAQKIYEDILPFENIFENQEALLYNQEANM